MEKKMANQVNSSTFKKNQSQKKKNPWIPLVVIVVLALLMVLLNYFMLDVTNAVYQTQQETVQENAAVQANTGADMQMEAAITKTQPEKGVLALADVKIGDFMTIRNVRIKEDDYGLTVAMPKTKAGANEQYKDAVFFADRGIKERFDQTVQKAYETFMHQQTDLDEEPEEAEELEQEESGMNMGM